MIEYNHTCVSQRSSQKLRPPGTISSWHFLSIFITCNIIDVWIPRNHRKKNCYHLKTFFTRIHASKKILNFVDHESYYTSGASILHFEFIMGPDHLFSFYTQCPRTDLNKRFLPRPKTTTAWKLTPHRSKISKNWNPHWWVPLHRFFKNWFLLIQKQLYSNYIQTHFT